MRVPGHRPDEGIANAASTAGGQELVTDSSNFTAWLQATAAHMPEISVAAGRSGPVVVLSGESDLTSLATPFRDPRDTRHATRLSV